MACATRSILDRGSSTWPARAVRPMTRKGYVNEETTCYRGSCGRDGVRPRADRMWQEHIQQLVVLELGDPEVQRGAGRDLQPVHEKGRDHHVREPWRLGQPRPA